MKTASFYSSAKPRLRTPDPLGNKVDLAKSKTSKSLPAMPRASSKRNTSARRSGVGGGKRRSSSFRRVSHGGHGIKKPKLKPAPYPALKISELPAMSIELPNSTRTKGEANQPEVKEVASAPATPYIPSTPSTPSTNPGTPGSSGRRAGTTPSGQINLTPRTKVQFEARAKPPFHP